MENCKIKIIVEKDLVNFKLGLPLRKSKKDSLKLYYDGESQHKYFYVRYNVSFEDNNHLNKWLSATHTELIDGVKFYEIIFTNTKKELQKKIDNLMYSKQLTVVSGQDFTFKCDVERIEKILEIANKESGKTIILENALNKTLIKNEHFHDAHKVWQNIFLIAYENKVSITKVLSETEYILNNDEQINDEPLQNIALLALNILAEKLKCHISDFFNFDETYIKKKVYNMIEKLDWADFDLNLECEATEESFEEMGGILFEWEPEFSDCDDCYEVYKMKCDNGDILYRLSISAGYMVGFQRSSSDRFANFFYGGASIYSETEGPLKDFVENLINKHKPAPTFKIEPTLLPESEINSANLSDVHIKPKTKERKEVQLGDLVVRMNIFKCSKKHTLEDIDAIIKVINDDDTESTIVVPAGYCKECNVYFIMESTYQRLVASGRFIKCRICNEKAYREYSSKSYSGYMKNESILRQYGYNTDKNEGLSATQRQKILAIIIDNSIMRKTEIINLLDWLIRTREGVVNMKLAVSKWEADREFVENYRIGEYTQYGVNAIYRR